MTLSAHVDFTHQMKQRHLGRKRLILVFSPRLTLCTHPFIVFERSREAHRLDELCEGADLLLRVLTRLLHVTELKDKKKKWSGEKTAAKTENAPLAGGISNVCCVTLVKSTARDDAPVRRDLYRSLN